MYGFTARNLGMKLIRFPQEDSFRFDPETGIFAVADGITRDCLNGRVADKTLAGIWNVFWHYPRPSPAREAADLFCRVFTAYASKFSPEDAIFQGFREANKGIHFLNQREGLEGDYLVGDFAGCVGAGAIKKEDYLFWGFLCDCGVAVLDKKGNLRFKTDDEGPHGKERKEGLDLIVAQNKGWANPEARRTIRRDYRNNSNQKDSFGVLTGETSAMDYVRTGVQRLRNGDYFLVYTDGMLPILFDSETEEVIPGFRGVLKEGSFERLENFCRQNVRSEGTMIISQY